MLRFFQVAFEAAKAAQRAGIDVLLVDTAGRMQVRPECFDVYFNVTAKPFI